MAKLSRLKQKYNRTKKGNSNKRSPFSNYKKSGSSSEDDSYEDVHKDEAQADLFLLPGKGDFFTKRSPGVNPDVPIECLMAPEDEDEGDVANVGTASLTMASNLNIDSESPLHKRRAQFYNEVDKKINA